MERKPQLDGNSFHFEWGWPRRKEEGLDGFQRIRKGLIFLEGWGNQLILARQSVIAVGVQLVNCQLLRFLVLCLLYTNDPLSTFSTRTFALTFDTLLSF